MNNYTLRTALERRQQIQEGAAALGINDAYISQLVDEFYRRIRQDTRLGPIFDQEIGDHWEIHLSRMKAFWASVAMNAGTYSGRPVPAHQKLVSVIPSDFQIWLQLFYETLEDTAPTPGAISYFMERAERIARSLQMAMFSSPHSLTEGR